jgi:hypothetical protein
VPTGGLVGEWKLDGNVNDTKNGFNATLFGSPPYISAKIGQGLDLTGNGTGGQGGKYAEMPANATLNDLAEGAAYSISAWFNPASIPSGVAPSQFWMVVGKTNSQAIGIVYNSNQKFAARHYLDGNLLRLTTSAAQFGVNQWHHAVAVVTKGSATVAGSLKLYVNGQLVDTDTWTGGTAAKDFGTTAKWRIGKSDTDWSAHGRVDQVRFYNVALTQAQVTDLFQETAPPAGNARLPVGRAGYSGLIGAGPGGPADPTKYTAVGQYIAGPSTIVDEINAAKDAGVLLLVTLARGRSTWAPNGNYDPAAYEADIRRFEDPAIKPVIQAAVNEQRIAFMTYDEPNHPDFGTPSTICPHHVNDGGLLHKEIWPGAITYVRSPSRVMDGSTWNNVCGEDAPPPGTGWSGIDYGVSQYTYNSTRQHPWTYFDAEKANFASIGLGMLPFINYWNGGNWVDLPATPTGGPAIPMCWDIENNNSSSGVIVGSSEPSDGLHLACGDARIGDPDFRLLVASPALMKAIAQWAANDPDSPVLSGYQWAHTAGAVFAQWAINLQARADIVAAGRQMITIGNGRTSSNGWRPIK